MWVSSDKGENWTSSATENLPNPGVAALAFNPRKPDVRYLATGDPDCILDPHEPAAGCEYCHSRGVVKSTDGGKTWSGAIGKWYTCDGKEDTAFWSFPSKKILRKLTVHPEHPKVLLAIMHTYISATKTFDGMVYRSEDSGENWYPVLCVRDGFLKDMEFQPGNPEVVYASGRTIYRSADGGQHWEALPNRGLPADSLVARCELSISAANPQKVFALFILKNAYMSDFYISENAGKSFKKIMSVPGSPEWRTALAADPLDEGRVYFSAGNRVNKLLSYKGNWNYKNAGNGLHDDVHDLTCDPSGRFLFASTDGGLYVTADEGENWKQISKGLNVAECWSVAVSQQKPYRVLAGMQDCGTQQYRPQGDSLPGWHMVRGGDGMECAIDPLNPKVQYSNDGNNNLTARSEDGGITWSRNIAASRREKAHYLRPFLLDPVHPDVLYTGYHNVYKSRNSGEVWSAISAFKQPDQNATLIALAVSPSDTLCIYAAFSSPAWTPKPEERLFKTKDGGNSWMDITPGLKGVSYSQITSLAVQPDDGNTLLVGFRGGWEFKIMKTKSGGEGANCWVNFSSGLPSDADVNAILFDTDLAHTVYIGTHIGVFVTRDKLNAWKSFNTGLPRVMVSDLDILHQTQELYIGTHGRGVWKSTLFGVKE
ncbi:MAG TPA: hypothetical protein PLU53_10470 [Bacteroidia bacterium]|nr:hypothetical protein [Bacteroidia bacterium]